jgi:Rieske 2Fe-2S family protein
MARSTRRRRHRAADWRPRPTLAGTDYTSAAVWDEEREQIWFGGWVCLGRAEEIAQPGDYLVRDLAGESIFVVRNQAGALRAFYNVCAHRGTRILDEEPACGHLGKAVKCPYHAWSYDFDGRLIGTPSVHEDEAFERRTTP